MVAMEFGLAIGAASSARSVTTASAAAVVDTGAAKGALFFVGVVVLETLGRAQHRIFALRVFMPNFAGRIVRGTR